jgi:hypothetical protein
MKSAANGMQHVAEREIHTGVLGIKLKFHILPSGREAGNRQK